MGLLRIVPVVVLVMQLQALTEAASSLPWMPGNRIAEGPDTELPNAHVIDCGRIQENAGTVTKAITTSRALGYFPNYAFTAGPIAALNPAIPNNIGKFTFAEIKGRHYVYGLQKDRSGEEAYWLPQGGYIDIPRRPNSRQPKYVFTPDFSGCVWTVTPMCNGNLRIRHVEGGKEASQFNNLSEADKGGPNTYALEFKDYGYVVETWRLVKSIRAFAYMHYTGGQWTLTFQRQTCATTIGGYRFEKGMLKSTTNIDHDTRYKPIDSTKTFYIP